MTIDEKAQFIREQFVPLLESIPADTKPLWGKMTAQQMIEHLSDYMRIHSGKAAHTEIVTPPAQLEWMRNFLETNKPFRENTKNPLMSELPAPVRNVSKDVAVKELKEELKYFFAVFEKDKLQVTRNPFFGDLNYEQNIQLLYKHASHHLKQFGLTINAEKNL